MSPDAPSPCHVMPTRTEFPDTPIRFHPASSAILLTKNVSTYIDAGEIGHGWRLHRWLPFHYGSCKGSQQNSRKWSRVAPRRRTLPDFIKQLISGLEPISKSSEEDNEAGELYKAEEVLSVVLPADEDATLPLYPGEEALDEPAPHVTA